MIELELTLPLAGFSLEIRTSLGSGTTALVGPSGSGKTSLLEALAGLRPKSRGRVVIDGIDVAGLPPERRGIGYVPQDAALFPHLSVRDNILFARDDATRFASLCETLELQPLLSRVPATLSGGERQRVALARALMAEPRLLLLDEPLAAVDQPLREKIIAFLRRVRDREPVPMLYVTHQPFEAIALASDCILLRDGKVVAQGPPHEVLYGAAENVFEVADPEHDPEHGVTRVRTTAGLPLVLPHDQVSMAAFPLTVRISGDDIVVFGAEPRAISSRNVLRGSVRSIRTAAGISDVIVDAVERFHVRLTGDAVEDLALQPGMVVWLALRSRAFRIVG